jgi:hypothetical protein
VAEAVLEKALDFEEAVSVVFGSTHVDPQQVRRAGRLSVRSDRLDDFLDRPPALAVFEEELLVVGGGHGDGGPGGRECGAGAVAVAAVVVVVVGVDKREQRNACCVCWQSSRQTKGRIRRVAVLLVEATIRTSIASSLLHHLPWTDLVDSTDSSCLVQQRQQQQLSTAVSDEQ